MKKILHDIWNDPILCRPLFLICVFFFLAHQIAEKWMDIHLKWADNYLDMLVLMPILLTLYTVEKMHFRHIHVSVSRSEIIFLTLIVGFISEFVFPYFSYRFTYDLFDLIFLWIGSLAFYLDRYFLIKLSVK